MNVWVNGRKLRLDPAAAIGKGGEADVFDIGHGQALKLFKPPDHPDLAGEPAAQQAARERLDEHQEKLRAFPTHLPERVIVPESLAVDRFGHRILGYTMRLLSGAEVLWRYGERQFREGTIPAQEVVDVFRDLHGTVVGVHAAGVVIGDFNDLNVLVVGRKAFLIDADSFQFGRFVCRVFTERLVDPLLCDPSAGRPLLLRPHGRDSDWYAFTAMLLRCLLYVDPYGGVYRPAPGAARLSPAARPLHRITLFHRDVVYPRPALPPDILPDDLLDHFHQVFEKDRRGEFPRRLLEALRFTRCTVCGAEHARSACPACRAAAPAAIREVVIVRGSVRATRVFRTAGLILQAAVGPRGLKLLTYESGALKREDGSVVLEGALRPHLRFRLSGDRVLVGQDRRLVVLDPPAPPRRVATDLAPGHRSFDANADALLWLEDGRLLRDGVLGPERVGDVLANRTVFWVGPDFGFGFYRAGRLSVAFVFEAKGHALNDRVALPAVKGQLVDATCVFGKDRCFFLTTAREAGRSVNRCVMIRRDGSIEAEADAETGDGSWLSFIRGACAVGESMFVPTDNGIVRVEAHGDALVVTREFPDTEPFVDAGCRLLPGADGLYVVDRQEVHLLKMA